MCVSSHMYLCGFFVGHYYLINVRVCACVCEPEMNTCVCAREYKINVHNVCVYGPHTQTKITNTDTHMTNKTQKMDQVLLFHDTAQCIVLKICLHDMTAAYILGILKKLY